MTLEQRLSNLENLVDALSKKIDRNQFYTDADMQGNRQSISNVTPYTETKTAYIGDTEVVFQNKQGNLLIYTDKPFPYSVDRNYDFIVVNFEPLEEVSQITISIQ